MCSCQIGSQVAFNFAAYLPAAVATVLSLSTAAHCSVISRSLLAAAAPATASHLGSSSGSSRLAAAFCYHLHKYMWSHNC